MGLVSHVKQCRRCDTSLHVAVFAISIKILLFQVTRDGRIMDEGIIRVNNARKEHKARSKDVLADSIVNKAIELEVVLCKHHSS